MYILNAEKTKLFDLTCMSHVFVNEKGDAVLICGSIYRGEGPVGTVTLGRYWSVQMAKEVLHDICIALYRDAPIFDMPAAADMAEQKRVRDARVSRRGGS